MESKIVFGCVTTTYLLYIFTKYYNFSQEHRQKEAVVASSLEINAKGIGMDGITVLDFITCFIYNQEEKTKSLWVRQIMVISVCQEHWRTVIGHWEHRFVQA